MLCTFKIRDEKTCVCIRCGFVVRETNPTIIHAKCAVVGRCKSMGRKSGKTYVRDKCKEALKAVARIYKCSLYGCCTKIQQSLDHPGMKCCSECLDFVGDKP